MIPTIEQILQDVAAGTMTLEVAEQYIQRHMELVMNMELEKDQQNYVRDEYIKAMLTRPVPVEAKSDSVAMFVWDTAQRIMALRAKNVPPSVPEVMKQEESASGITAPATVPFPANGTPPEMPTEAPVQQRWGDGSTYTPQATPMLPPTDQHDDGPF